MFEYFLPNHVTEQDKETMEIDWEFTLSGQPQALCRDGKIRFRRKQDETDAELRRRIKEFREECFGGKTKKENR